MVWLVKHSFLNNSSVKAWFHNSMAIFNVLAVKLVIGQIFSGKIFYLNLSIS